MLTESESSDIHSDFAHGLSPENIIRHTFYRNVTKDAEAVHELISNLTKSIHFCTYTGTLKTHFGDTGEGLTEFSQDVTDLPCYRPVPEIRQKHNIDDRIFPYRQTIAKENCSHIDDDDAVIKPCDYIDYQQLVNTEILKSALACKIPLGIKTLHTENYRKLVKIDSAAKYLRAVLALKMGRSFEQVAQECSMPVELVRGVWGDFLWQAEWNERKLLKLPYVTETCYGLVTGKFGDTNVEGAPALCLLSTDDSGQESFVAYTSIPVRDKEVPLVDAEGVQQKMHGQNLVSSRYILHGRVSLDAYIPPVEKVTASKFLEELEYCRDVTGFRDDLLKAVQ